jgi:hypothetical protein
MTNQEILEIAKKRISDEFLFFGLMERFDESLHLLTYTLGWRPIQNYRKKMVAPKPNRLEDIPAETIEAIRDRNQLDIELYNYAADLFKKRYQTMIQNLLEKSYQAHYSKWRSNQDQFEISMDEPVDGLGWYPREIAPGGNVFRWMGPENEAFIDVNLAKNSSFVITIHIVDSIHTDCLQNFKFLTNEIEVPLKLLSGDAYRGIYQGVISADLVELVDAPTRLSFHVSSSFTPKEMNPNNSDTRKLSIALHKIVIQKQTEEQV